MKRLVRVSLLLVVALALVTGCGQDTTKPLAYIAGVEKGDVFVKKAGGTEFAKAAEGVNLFAGDTVKTDANAMAVVKFKTTAISRIMPNTEFVVKLEKVVSADSSIIYTNLVNGIAYFYVDKNREAAKKFEVETNMVIASIKGTVFKMAADDKKTTLTVMEGLVDFAKKDGSKSISVPGMMEAQADGSGLTGPTTANSLTDPYLAECPVIKVQASRN